jgi:hypothetical protein
MLNFSNRFFDTANSNVMPTSTNSSSSSQMSTAGNSSVNNSSNTGSMGTMIDSQPYVLVPYAMFQQMSGSGQSQSGSGQSMPSGSSSSSSGNNPQMSGTMSFQGPSGNQFVMQGNFYNPVFYVGNGGEMQFSPRKTSSPVRQPQNTNGSMQMLPSNSSSVNEPMLPEDSSQVTASGDTESEPEMPMQRQMPYRPQSGNHYSMHGNFHSPNFHGNSQAQDNSNYQQQPSSQYPQMNDYQRPRYGQKYHPMAQQQQFPTMISADSVEEPSLPPQSSTDEIGDSDYKHCAPPPKMEWDEPMQEPQEPPAADETAKPEKTTKPCPPPKMEYEESVQEPELPPATDETTEPTDESKPCPPPKGPKPIFGSGDGSYEGDPHLVGFDGEKYDVMGSVGKTYNMISDKNFQYNTNFIKMGPDAVSTAIGSAGLLVGKDKVSLDAKVGTPTLNGTPLQVNKKATLADGTSTALWDGKSFVLNSPEYTVNLKVSTDSGSDTKYLDSTVKLANGDPFADGVKPHGLMGQTADGIAGAKNSGVDRGKQGGTVIDGVVDDYEVKDLFDTAFKNFNRFVG